MKCSAFLALMVSALVLAGSAGAGVNVWFVADGKPVSVPRNGTTLQRAVQQLLAGPTAAERGRGIHSAVPRATPLRSITVTHRVVTVDLGARFAAGRDGRLLQARVGQLVRTLRGVPGVRGVQVLIDGGVPVGLFPGYDLSKPVVAPVEPAEQHELTTRDIQQRLIDLGFMARLGADRRRRHADLDGGARIPEVGEPPARRRARRLDRRSRSSGRRGPSPGYGCPAAGSRCSFAASSRC